METILVGIDGSPASIRALEQAVAIARPVEARVELVYATTPLLLPPYVSPEEAQSFRRSEADLVQDQLRSHVEKARAAGVKVEWTVVFDADAAETLANLSGRRDVSLTVVGSHGRGVLARALFGSTSYKLVHLAKKPLLVVH